MAKHDSGKAERIFNARKHWENRAVDRPRQVWNPQTKEWNKVLSVVVLSDGYECPNESPPYPHDHKEKR